VSSYPAPERALGGIAAIHRATGLPTGYSDHTPDIDTGAVAAALGACVLEKHLTYDRLAQGPDHAASLEPKGMAAYVRAARAVRCPKPEGAGAKGVLVCERDVREVSRQSLVSTRVLREGDVLTREMLTIKRPGAGMPPYMLSEMIGRRVVRVVEMDVPIVREDVE